MLAVNGVEALVPEIVERVLFQKKAKYRPWAEISGYPRPSEREDIIRSYVPLE